MSLRDSELVPERACGSGTAIAGAQTERRISWLTLVIGFAMAAGFLSVGRAAWAAGIAIGTVLGWLNFRWLGRGLDALVAASMAQSNQLVAERSEVPEGGQQGAQEAKLPQEGRAEARVPMGTYFTALFRYALMGLCVYVIFIYLHVPLGSLMVGLCALGAAALAASVYEILRPAD
jgi:hypothetical protein